LYYAKVSTLSSEDQKVMIDTNKLLKDVINTLDQQISESNAQIHIKDLPNIYGYNIQIFQLFMNLINNALKYRSDKQPLIDIFAKETDAGMEFHVKDNGIGIEDAYLQSIFGFSKRLHSSNEYEGSGIGLSSCRKIVENHNGTIGVTSQKGVGSDFYFTLPRG
jgi:light-regulated signal transduction histidine kinase (bacteriophytochrome)